MTHSRRHRTVRPRDTSPLSKSSPLSVGPPSLGGPRRRKPQHQSRVSTEKPLAQTVGLRLGLDNRLSRQGRTRLGTHPEFLVGRLNLERSRQRIQSRRQVTKILPVADSNGNARVNGSAAGAIAGRAVTASTLATARIRPARANDRPSSPRASRIPPPHRGVLYITAEEPAPARCISRWTLRIGAAASTGTARPTPGTAAIGTLPGAVRPVPPSLLFGRSF